MKYQYDKRIVKIIAELGVLPVYLLHNQKDDSKYALLNGTKNNFCIDFNNEFDKDIYRSFAWSANINNFLSINGNDALLFSSNKRDPEKIKYDIIINNLPKFHEYLTKREGNKEDSIIPFVLKIYRKMRNLLRETSGNEALRAFLYLLSNVETDNVILNEWGLPIESTNVVKNINYTIWEELIDELRNGVVYENLKPDISLILRHTAGQLFEEANYIAQFGQQLDLFPTEFISYDYNPKQVGAYFTPSHISRSIVQESFHFNQDIPQHVKIFDPACGAGEFLVESLRQLKVKGYTGTVEIIGWDIAQTALDMAKYTLTFEKREWGDRLDISRLELKNSLTGQWPQNIDYIFMNPPFISWEQMDGETREYVKAIIGEKGGRPNLAAVFYYLANESLSNNGVLGCLIPSSILNSDSHKEIRNVTKERLFPKLIGRLGNYIFENAFVDACLIVASRKNQDENTKILWTQNIDDASSKALRELRKQNISKEAFTDQKDFSIYSVPTKEVLNEESWMPISYQAAKNRTLLNIKMLKNRLVKTENLFDVKQGARTGLNKVFIISSATYESFSKKEQKYFRPSIDSSSLRNGLLIKSNYIFFPYSEGLEEIETEVDLAKYVPTYYKLILKPNEKNLKKRKIDHVKWWVLTRDRSWQRSMQPKLVSTEFGKAGNFGFDKVGEYVVERGSAWFLLDKETLPQEFYYAYLAIFNSEKMNTLLNIYSRQLAGGSWYSLDAKNVGKIPLPNFEHKSNKEFLPILIDFGLNMINQETYNREILDQVISEIYGF